MRVPPIPDSVADRTNDGRFRYRRSANAVLTGNHPRRTDHATFTGTVSFFASGDWTTKVDLRVEGQAGGIDAGTVAVR